METQIITDKELATLETLHTILLDFDRHARCRMLGYLEHRLGQADWNLKISNGEVR